jgi:hypothetical protein
MESFWIPCPGNNDNLKISRASNPPSPGVIVIGNRNERSEGPERRIYGGRFGEEKVRGAGTLYLGLLRFLCYLLFNGLTAPAFFIDC